MLQHQNKKYIILASHQILRKTFWHAISTGKLEEMARWVCWHLGLPH
uniref:Uncharacterized protein n=1 Tax=Escherichia phage PMBT16 TaxID=3137282 RepID=A0AAU8BSF1_9VIRU